MSANYPSDVTDEQWQVLRKLLPRSAKRGRRPIDRRWILNAVLHLNRTGCQWRCLAKLRNLGRLRVVFADSIYGRCGLPEWVSETFGWILQTVLRPVCAAGFVVLPKRWIVERTFAWISRCRRHSKDYERTVESSVAMIYVTMIGLMSRRLARQEYI